MFQNITAAICCSLAGNHSGTLIDWRSYTYATNGTDPLKMKRDSFFFWHIFSLHSLYSLPFFLLYLSGFLSVSDLSYVTIMSYVTALFSRWHTFVFSDMELPPLTGSSELHFSEKRRQKDVTYLDRQNRLLFCVCACVLAELPVLSWACVFVALIATHKQWIDIFLNCNMKS